MKNFTLTIHVNVEARSSAEAWEMLGDIAGNIEGRYFHRGASVDIDAATVEEG